ncbi:double zinc ribbon domain-containing protein [Patulibacter sp. SYSU D01012]|uniref:ComF family protein n=1 Tax=Patulibacter sp. SYSU D01012 TaxID=2817381 RepID=UPI001B3123C4|nr:double zinc ribbon domain-containing protein [Patulibacter sp. SYSU D01012]
MARIVDLVAAALVPERCLHCRGPARAGAPLCDACRRALPWLPVDGCPRCGLPRPCAQGRCPAARTALAGAWAPLAHEGAARALVLAAKARAARRVAPWLAAAMTARAPAGLLAGVEVVVPAAADPARRRRRGEDHARLVADAVGRALDAPVAPLLVRRRSAPAQHARGRTARLTLPPPIVAGPVPAVVLLVDDVHTTGATLAASADALRAAGAQRVVALTATRALR